MTVVQPGRPARSHCATPLHFRWAFVPGDCPSGGCPLFVAIDGTGDEFFDPNDQQNWMIEMVRRGFAGVTMAYANSPNDFGFCFGQPFLSNTVELITNLPGAAEFGVVQKAQSIFDATREGSIVQQACDGPDAFANCDLGIAVAGEGLAREQTCLSFRLLLTPSKRRLVPGCAHVSPGEQL